MAAKRPAVSDDESDFTDELVESGDEDVKPGSKSILQGALNEPKHTSYNMQHVHELVHHGLVELNPPYQRDVVWPEAKQIGLIQSIFLKNYYLPPLIFAVHTAENEEEVRTCIDGKQRCTSIVKFMDGVIPFISPVTKERYWYSKFGTTKRGHQLSDAMKRKFQTALIGAAEYKGITDLQERDIFQRVQMGVSLSAAEKLQAIAGPWSVWITNLIKQYVSEPETLGDRIVWDQNRGRPFQNLATFIVLAYDPENVRGVPSAAKMKPFLDREDPPDGHFKRKVEMTLGLFVKIATEHYDISLGVVEQRVAPVEFVFTAFIIFSRMGAFSVKSLAQMIGEMRTEMRARHPDIRTNTRVASDFQEHVRKLPFRAPPGEVPAAEEFAGDLVDPRDRRAAKRARRDEDDDPTYRDTLLPRDLQAEANGGPARQNKPRNGAAAAAAAPPGRPNAQQRAHAPPAPAAVRPPAAAMDRPSANPYGSGQPPAGPQYSAAQIAHYNAIAQGQMQTGGAGRWQGAQGGQGR